MLVFILSIERFVRRKKIEMVYTNYECHYSPFALMTDVINQSIRVTRTSTWGSTATNGNWYKIGILFAFQERLPPVSITWEKWRVLSKNTEVWRKPSYDCFLPLLLLCVTGNMLGVTFCHFCPWEVVREAERETPFSLLPVAPPPLLAAPSSMNLALSCNSSLF